MYIEQDVTFGKTQSWSYVEFQHVPEQPLWRSTRVAMSGKWMS